MPIRAVLLDKDGTILDVEATWGRTTVAVIRKLADGDAALADRLVALAMVDPATGRFDPEARSSPARRPTTDRPGPRRSAARPVPPSSPRSTRSTASSAGRTSRRFPARSRPSRHCTERGVPLGLATNDAEENARDNLDDLGVAAFFSFVAGYDSGHGAKPGPGMVIAFAEHAGVEPGEVALIGDSLHDLIAARSAGAVAVAVTTGMAGADELRPLADVLANDLAAAVRRDWAVGGRSASEAHADFSAPCRWARRFAPWPTLPDRHPHVPRARNSLAREGEVVREAVDARTTTGRVTDYDTPDGSAGAGAGIREQPARRLERRRGRAARGVRLCHCRRQGARAGRGAGDGAANRPRAGVVGVGGSPLSGAAAPGCRGSGSTRRSRADRRERTTRATDSCSGAG